MDTLQATHDFIASYDLLLAAKQTSGTAIMDMIDEDKELLGFDEDLNESSEDDASLSSLDNFSRGTFVTLRNTKEAAIVSPTSNCESVTSLVTNAPWPTVSKRPNKRRRRGPPRKEEIANLHKMALSLSKKLRSLQVLAENADAACQSEEMNVVGITLWKGIACRQLALRRSSEELNGQLHEEVMAQAKHAANLKRMLKRRYSEEVSQVARYCVSLRVDALFAKKAMTNARTSEQTYPNTVNGIYLEIRDKNQVPFALQNTTRAIWKYFGGKKTRDGDHVQTKVGFQNPQCYVYFTDLTRCL
ncbi:unnamed protein product [Phytophthora fragariaefolia]|uniref:Unnamed protein product n=1 Tax=Phytophthora fragariaefolia TaxID=1490495 RepID=A0A9W6XID0_9STRA|nr:unnamed protein product [Phytophthora fragariaefolia]